MWPYAAYFVVGGTLVSAVAYVGKHGDGMSAAFVAGLPVLFLINVVLLCQSGGIAAGLSYARGALVYLPMFVGCVLLTMMLLPRIGMPWAALAGASVYLVLMVRPSGTRRAVSMCNAAAVQGLPKPDASQEVVGPEVAGDVEHSGGRD